MVDNRTSIDVRGMHGPSPPDYTIIPIGSVERLFSIAVAITRTMSGNLTLQIPTKLIIYEENASMRLIYLHVNMEINYFI